MKLVAAIVAVALGAAAAAHAQTAAPVPDPAKLALAEQIVATQGGEDRMRSQLDSMTKAMDRLAQAALPPGTKNYANPLHEVMRREILAMIPDLLKVGETVYAEQLSEQELSDLLAWQRSPSGRAITAKSPAILNQTMQLTTPLVMARMPSILRDSVKAMCAEQHCSPEDQRVMAAAVDAALPKSPAG